jgi:hypothetical protein
VASPVRWTLPLSIAAHVAIAGALLLPRGVPADPGGPPADPAPALAGETFELPAPDTQEAPLANASPSPDDVGAPAPAEAADAPARPRPPRSGKAAARPSNAARPSAGHTAAGDGDEGGASGTGLTFGAVGDRSASDLLTAITHGFAQGASGDPAWRSAPLGSAGEATLVLTLDESGHLESEQLLGSPGPALASGIRRTLALVRGRPFIARGKVTRLHLAASVSSDSVHDATGGDVFAIGRSVAGGEGHGWFALAIGRRIDLRVRPK